MKSDTFSNQPFETLPSDSDSEDQPDMIDDQAKYDEKVLEETSEALKTQWSIAAKASSVKDSLLRSSLCRQPPGTAVDSIPREDGMATASAEPKLARAVTVAAGQTSHRRASFAAWTVDAIQG
jgi:hypothetical protein